MKTLTKLSKWDIPVSFYVKCPKENKEIPVAECESCEHHKGFAQGSLPFRIWCGLLENQFKLAKKTK
ncbi:MAG: hypothetical protein ACTSP4_00170 [Candidatus Hodarchaeales archaeon]